MCFRASDTAQLELKSERVLTPALAARSAVFCALVLPVSCASAADFCFAAASSRSACALRPPPPISSAVLASSPPSQGLILVPFSAQLERILWDRGCTYGVV